MTGNAPASINFDLNDFQVMVNFIDISVQRGAVRGEELTLVGNLRTNLVNVLKAAQQETPTAPQVSEDASDTSDAE
jgi:hypothetical protein